MLALLILYAVTGFKTGNEFVDVCGLNKVACNAYVEGVADERNALQAEGLVKRSVCIPQNVTGDELTAVAQKYFTDHPERRHFLAADEISFALMVTYPCGQAESK